MPSPIKRMIFFACPAVAPLELWRAWAAWSGDETNIKRRRIIKMGQGRYLLRVT
jgi:hypothetical protein